MLPPVRNPGEGWHRLHPLSPVVRFGRLLLALVAVIAVESRQGARHGTRTYLIVVGAFLFVAIVAQVVNYLVTRWRVEGTTLRIEKGLIKRASIQIPLPGIQAVDLVAPLLARVFGLKEVRVRTGGASRGDGRLEYLREADAEALRARLLAIAHGVHEDTPAPPEMPLLQVPARRLIGAVLLRGQMLVSLLVMVAGVALIAVSPAAAAALGVSGLTFLFGIGSRFWRQLNGELGFSVAEAPDGLRVRSGLLQTVSETIPRGRIQSVRLVEPLLWRRFGWCRVELHVAGGEQRSENRQSRQLSRALLPVGSHVEAAFLLGRLLPGLPQGGAEPPRRARWKSPLRFHYLRINIGSWYAAAGTGRVQRVTTFVPLSKVQSIRMVQGPVQRRLSLATVRLDTPGRWHTGDLVDRSIGEATELVERLPAMCRQARAFERHPVGT